MASLLERVNWSEYLLLLSKGNPPVALQLLIANTVILVLWLVFRARSGAPVRSHAGGKSGQRHTLALQGLFVVANLLIVNYGDRLFI